MKTWVQNPVPQKHNTVVVQEDQETKVILDYIASLKPAWDI